MYSGSVTEKLHASPVVICVHKECHEHGDNKIFTVVLRSQYKYICALTLQRHIFRQLYIWSWTLGLLSSSVKHCMLIDSAYWFKKNNCTKQLIAATRKHRVISALVFQALWLNIAILTAIVTIITWYIFILLN